MLDFFKNYVFKKPDEQRLSWLYIYNKRATLSGLVFLFITFTALALVDSFFFAVPFYASLSPPQQTPFWWDSVFRLCVIPAFNLAAIVFVQRCHNCSTKRLQTATVLVLVLTMSSLICTGIVQDYYSANDYTWEVAALIVFTLTMFGLTFRTSLFLSLFMLATGVAFLVYDHVEQKIFVYNMTFLLVIWVAMIVGAYRKAELRRDNFNAFAMLEKSAQELDRKAKELAQRNHELQQFAFASSHDLQEPLRTITNFVGILERRMSDQLTDEMRMYMGFISKSTERMKHLIQAILEYCNIGRNLKLEEFSCDEKLFQVIADLNYSISQSNACIEVGELPKIKGYSTEFSMLMQNLVGNAIKFRKKEAFPNIRIFAEEDKQSFHFSVADNGIGIEPKHLEKVFVLFGRLHTKEDYEGTGIGLAHCKKIVDLHGGRIWVESQPNRGSIFHFTISKHLVPTVNETPTKLYHAHR